MRVPVVPVRDDGAFDEDLAWLALGDVVEVVVYEAGRSCALAGLRRGRRSYGEEKRASEGSKGVESGEWRVGIRKRQTETNRILMFGSNLLTLPVSSFSFQGMAVTLPVVSLRPQVWLMKVLPLPSLADAAYCGLC